MPIVKTQPDALTAAESSRLKELESAVEKNLAGAREAWAALAEIREKRLYRATHDTFEDYCRGAWGLTRRHVNREIQAAEVIANLGPMGPIPENERQARPLAALPADQQSDAWNEAVATAPAGKVTAAHVAEVVKRRTTPEVTFGAVTDTEETARDDSTDADDDEAERKAANKAYADNAPFAALAEHDAKHPPAPTWTKHSRLKTCIDGLDKLAAAPAHHFSAVEMKRLITELKDALSAVL